HVGRRTQDNRRFVVEQETQPGGAAHAAARQPHATKLGRRVECRPEPQERPKGKCEEESIARANADDSVNAVPAAEQPVPAFRSIQPAQRLPRCARSLVQPAIALQRISQIASIGRMRRLIGKQLRLRGKREPVERLASGERGNIDSGKLVRIELVSRQDFAQQSAESPALPFRESWTIQSFLRHCRHWRILSSLSHRSRTAVLDHAGSAGRWPRPDESTLYPPASFGCSPAATETGLFRATACQASPLRERSCPLLRRDSTGTRPHRLASPCLVLLLQTR